MQTMRDFLIYYNNLDVEPFLEALGKMGDFWSENKIDMFKDAVSLPGIAMQFELGFLKEQGIHLSAFHNKQLYEMFRKNIVGGPAIIFKRYAEAEKSCLRKDPERVCRRVIGYDANGLYLWALCEPMPVGLYTHWQRKDDKMVSSVPWREADEWLAWEGHNRRTTLVTRLNGGEKRLGDRQLTVDGFDPSTNTYFEFLGCYWHGCPRCFTPDDPHPKRGKTFHYWYEKTQAKLKYLKEIGYRAVEVWECDWRNEARQQSVQNFLDSHFPGRNQRPKTESQLLEQVKRGEFFGVLEVDLHVPDELRAKFEEMTPIFKNTEISPEHIGPHMKEFADTYKCMPKPRRSLIGSYCANKILLTTPLIKFYLSEGLIITKVHQAIQWTSNACFGPFGEFVSKARRQADEPGGSKILGETAKTVGNAGYGRFLMDVSRHEDVSYEEDEDKVARAINSCFFKDMDELDEGVYELKSGKKRVKLDLPIQVGFFVYNYAKLKMLEFYYHFIDRYLDRANFEYLEMDTDSAYIALAGSSIDELVKPELRKEYTANKHKWFPRSDTEEHAAYDKRTPGLFKVEWSGDGFVGLNSKTYCCWGSEGRKISCKGISKKDNDIKKDVYLRVLKSGKSEEAENRGFRLLGNRMMTYSQFKTGFSYFYPKRKVEEDGVSTKPLDI